MDPLLERGDGKVDLADFDGDRGGARLRARHVGLQRRLLAPVFVNRLLEGTLGGQALRNLLADLGADLLEIRLPLTQCSRRAGLGVRRGAGGFR